MGSRSGTTLYVTGFGQGTRARDLAFEFERFGRLVRCDIPAPRTASSRLFAFVEYESRRDADDAYHDMHNVRLGRDDVLKIEWARTPPSASWRFDPSSGREVRDSRPARRERSPRRGRSRSPPPYRGGRDGSAGRKDDRRERDYDRRGGDREERRRSRSPDDGLREREMKDERRSEEPVGNGVADRKESPPRPAEDELDVAE